MKQEVISGKEAKFSPAAGEAAGQKGVTTMEITFKQLAPALLVLLTMSVSGFAQEAPPDVKAKVDAQVKKLQYLSTDPHVVNAVKAYNVAPWPEAKGMTNEKWASLSVLDSFVRSLAKSELGEYLKSKKTELIVKLFVSGADGGKVAYDAKTQYWTHKGMPKHEVPMSGQTFIGPMKPDGTTGIYAIQVGLPVLDGGKPIGSVVVDLRIDKL